MAAFHISVKVTGYRIWKYWLNLDTWRWHLVCV